MKRICFFLSFGVLGAMEHPSDWPKDIYAAINKHNQAAVEYYAGDAKQLNAQAGYLPDEYPSGSDAFGVPDAKTECLCKLTCCCLCPSCCGYGIGRRTPLYCALSKRDIAAARALVEKGARLNAGKCVCSSSWQCCFGCLAGFDRVAFEPASVLLAKLARKDRQAHQLLSDVVSWGRPLMSGKESSDDELCRRLVELKDVVLTENMVKNKLIPLMVLLKTAVAEGDLVAVDCLLEMNPSRADVKSLVSYAGSEAVAARLTSFWGDVEEGHSGPEIHPISVPADQPDRASKGVQTEGEASV